MEAAKQQPTGTLDRLKAVWEREHSYSSLQVLKDFLLEHAPAGLAAKTKPSAGVVGGTVRTLDGQPALEDWLESQLNEVKKASPAPALNIEFRNFVANQKFSEETLMFRASIYLDGKKVGSVENDGRGGCCFWEFRGHEAAEKRIAEYVRLLPAMVFSGGSMHPKYDPEDLCRLTDCCGAGSTFHDETLCCKKCWNEVETGEGDGSEFVTFGEESLDSFFSGLANDMLKKKDDERIEKWVKKQATTIRATGGVPRRFTITKGSKVSVTVAPFAPTTTIEAALAMVQRNAKRGEVITGGEEVR